jgi:hypothetical protein
MSNLKIDPETVRRMGYQDIVAAEALDIGGIFIEVCLVAPGQDVSGDQYAVIEHQDCDPAKPYQGCSSVSPVGADRDKALEAYRTVRDDIRRSIDPIVPMR